MIPQASATPIAYVPVDVHGVVAVGGVLLLLAVITLGLGLLGLATRD